LAGMVPYQDISETSGFPEGFRYRGYYWAAEITAVSLDNIKRWALCVQTLNGLLATTSHSL